MMKLSYAVRQEATAFAKGYLACMERHGHIENWVDVKFFGTDYDIHIDQDDETGAYQAHIYIVVNGSTDTSAESKLF